MLNVLRKTTELSTTLIFKGRRRDVLTEKELNQVRDLKKKISDLERHLQTLRISAQNLVPVLDGLPHSTEAKSRVEKIALMIVEDERELKTLREEIILAKSKLLDKILSEVSDHTRQTLLALRYVECLSFKEVARRMKITLRHTFRLHENFFKCHIAAQNKS